MNAGKIVSVAAGVLMLAGSVVFAAGTTAESRHAARTHAGLHAKHLRASPLAQKKTTKKVKSHRRHATRTHATALRAHTPATVGRLHLPAPALS